MMLSKGLPSHEQNLERNGWKVVIWLLNTLTSSKNVKWSSFWRLKGVCEEGHVWETAISVLWGSEGGDASLSAQAWREELKSVLWYIPPGVWEAKGIVIWHMPEEAKGKRLCYHSEVASRERNQYGLCSCGSILCLWGQTVTQVSKMSAWSPWKCGWRGCLVGQSNPTWGHPWEADEGTSGQGRMHCVSPQLPLVLWSEMRSSQWGFWRT